MGDGDGNGGERFNNRLAFFCRAWSEEGEQKYFTERPASRLQLGRRPLPGPCFSLHNMALKSPLPPLLFVRNNSRNGYNDDSDWRGDRKDGGEVGKTGHSSEVELVFERCGDGRWGGVDCSWSEGIEGGRGGGCYR